MALVQVQESLLLNLNQSQSQLSKDKNTEDHLIQLKNLKIHLTTSMDQIPICYKSEMLISLLDLGNISVLLELTVLSSKMLSVQLLKNEEDSVMSWMKKWRLNAKLVLMLGEGMTSLFTNPKRW